MKKNPVVHFEMPYDDHERLAKFYTEVFGWQMQKTGKEMGDYVIAQTAETDDNQMIKNPGNINGGFAPRSKEYSLPSVVISVDDIQDSMKRISDAGGKVLGDTVEIPGVGHYVSFIDTEGNRVSILEPKNR